MAEQNIATTGSKKRHPIWGHISVVIVFSVLGVFLDVVFAPTPWYSAYSVGGYVLAGKSLLAKPNPSVVVVNLDDIVPLRDNRHDPKDKNDAEWNNVTKSWKELGAAVSNLQAHGAKGVCIDWELALKDDYLGIAGFYDDDKIPRGAQHQYEDLLKTLVKIDKSGCPVAFGADWVDSDLTHQRLNDKARWFPIPAATALAGSLRPAPTLMGGDAEGVASEVSAYPMPPANEIIARRLGDHLEDGWLIGFSPFDEESKAPHSGWDCFWLDYSTVNLHPVATDNVKGKVVVLASTSNNGNREDSAVIPGHGELPGGFYQAASIGTRISKPLYSFSSRWSEYIYLFLVNFFFGLLAIATASIICKRSKIPHESPNEHFVHFWSEAAVSVLAFVILLVLVAAVPTTRLLLPSIGAALVVRFLEPLFTLTRTLKLVKHWDEEGTT